MRSRTAATRGAGFGDNVDKPEGGDIVDLDAKFLGQQAREEKDNAQGVAKMWKAFSTRRLCPQNGKNGRR